MFGAMWLASGLATAGTVSLTTSDGVKVAGESWGSGTRGILLVHDEGRSRSDWSAVAPRLGTAGFQVLAIDLRGHGASAPGPVAEADWPKLEADVAAGVGWLTSRGVTEVHVVGARFGAALALQVASKTPDVDDLVLLSPPASLHGVKVSAAATAYNPRPLLVVSSTDDPIALKTAGWIASNATGHNQLLTFPDAGAGAVMLNKVASLETVILGWVGGGFDPKAADKGNLQNAVKSGVNDIETTGTRLEDR
jgi:pimeloyl-ACP methyl ester carboxylesterase